MAIGELARVDYKGSASFRIVQPDAKAKRRRRSQKPVGNNGGTPRPPSLALFSSPPHVDSINAPLLPPQSNGQPPLTLRTLVIEMWGESASASIDSGVTVNAQFIARAVEASPRNIYRAAVLGNLDLILAKEVESGNFIKVGEDQYRVSPYGGSHFQQHHSLLALNPPLAHPPPAPVPVQQLLMESRTTNGIEQPSPPNFSPSSPQIMPPPPPPPPPPPQTSATSPTTPTCPLPSLGGLPSDEQRKNDLIAAKLSKMEGKSKSPGKKASSGDKSRHKTLSNGHLDIKKEPEDCEDLPLTVARSVINHVPTVWDREEGSAKANAHINEPKSKPSKKRKLEDSAVQHIKMETGISDEATANSRSGTGRKKVRGGKIHSF